MTQIEQLREWVRESDNIVFFGGAGGSTESGIPDFRSVDGLYHQQYDYPPETILSHTFYRQKTEEFYRFYRARMLCPDYFCFPCCSFFSKCEKRRIGEEQRAGHKCSCRSTNGISKLIYGRLKTFSGIRK